jgi:hypothetical protein
MSDLVSPRRPEQGQRCVAASSGAVGIPTGLYSGWEVPPGHCLDRDRGLRIERLEGIGSVCFAPARHPSLPQHRNRCEYGAARWGRAQRQLEHEQQW